MPSAFAATIRTPKTDRQSKLANRESARKTRCLIA